jgi:hypothetical protein
MSDHDETLANFTAITGATESQALQMLEATGYSLEQAVELYFAAGGDVGVSTGPAAPSLPAAFNAEPEDDEALARRLQKYVLLLTSFPSSFILQFILVN